MEHLTFEQLIRIQNALVTDNLARSDHRFTRQWEREIRINNEVLSLVMDELKQRSILAA